MPLSFYRHRFRIHRLEYLSGLLSAILPRQANTILSRLFIEADSLFAHPNSLTMLLGVSEFLFADDGEIVVENITQIRRNFSFVGRYVIEGHIGRFYFPVSSDQSPSE